MEQVAELCVKSTDQSDTGIQLTFDMFVLDLVPLSLLFGFYMWISFVLCLVIMLLSWPGPPS